MSSTQIPVELRPSLSGGGALPPVCSAPMVLVLKDDKLGVGTLCRAVAAVIAAATITIAGCLEDAAACLRERIVDLLITDVAVGEVDVIDELDHWTSEPRRARRVLVVTRSMGAHILSTLSQTAVDGVFDERSEGEDELLTAMQRVWSGRPYWSRSALERLATGAMSGSSPFAQLSSTERMALSLIGDGSDDRELAAKLSITQSSARSIRGRIHEKLGLRTRADAMMAAVRLGLVRIDEQGVIRFGQRTLLVNRDKSLKHRPTRRSVAA